MRLWLFAWCGAMLVACAAPEARGDMQGAHPRFASRDAPHRIDRGHVRRGGHATRRLLLPFAGVDGLPLEAAGPDVVAATVPVSPLPIMPQSDDRPTVETTPSGVIVLRGEPSRRFGY